MEDFLDWLKQNYSIEATLIDTDEISLCGKKPGEMKAEVERFRNDPEISDEIKEFIISTNKDVFDNPDEYSRLDALAETYILTSGVLTEKEISEIKEKAVTYNITEEQLGLANGSKSISIENTKPILLDPPAPKDIDAWEQGLREEMLAYRKKEEYVASIRRVVKEKTEKPDCYEEKCDLNIDNLVGLYEQQLVQMYKDINSDSGKSGFLYFGQLEDYLVNNQPLQAEWLFSSEENYIKSVNDWKEKNNISFSDNDGALLGNLSKEDANAAATEASLRFLAKYKTIDELNLNHKNYDAVTTENIRDMEGSLSRLHQLYRLTSYAEQEYPEAYKSPEKQAYIEEAITRFSIEYAKKISKGEVTGFRYIPGSEFIENATNQVTGVKAKITKLRTHVSSFEQFDIEDRAKEAVEKYDNYETEFYRYKLKKCSCELEEKDKATIKQIDRVHNDSEPTKSYNFDIPAGKLKDLEEALNKDPRNIS